MIYLFAPGVQPRWAKIPAELIPALNDERAKPEAIEWLPVEEFEHTVELVGVALRRGVPVPGGVAVDYKHFDTFRKIPVHEEFLESFARVQPHNVLPDAFLEDMSPGWTEAAGRKDQEAADGVRRKLDALRAEQAAILAEPISGDVAAHWARLGGSI